MLSDSVDTAMVRDYKRKSTRASYGNEALQTALLKVQAGEMSKRKAELTYGVPRKTLNRHLSGIGLGRFSPVLSDEFEEALVKHAIELQRMFFGLVPADLRHSVDVVEYDETGLTFFLPNDFDHEVELDFSAALPIEISGETNPPADAGTAQDGAKSSEVAEHSASSIIELLSPMPKIQKVRPRSRKAQTAAVITSSPYKAELQKKQEMVANKIRKKMDKGKPSTKRAGKAKKPRRQEEQDETPCCICLKKYNAEPSVDFIQCSKCSAWYCEPCGPADINMCYNCLP